MKERDIVFIPATLIPARPGPATHCREDAQPPRLQPDGGKVSTSARRATTARCLDRSRPAQAAGKQVPDVDSRLVIHLQGGATFRPRTCRAMAASNSPKIGMGGQMGALDGDGLVAIQPTSRRPSHCQMGWRMRERGRPPASTVATVAPDDAVGHFNKGRSNL